MEDGQKTWSALMLTLKMETGENATCLSVKTSGEQNRVSTSSTFHTFMFDFVSAPSARFTGRHATNGRRRARTRFRPWEAPGGEANKPVWRDVEQRRAVRSVVGQHRGNLAAAPWH